MGDIFHSEKDLRLYDRAEPRLEKSLAVDLDFLCFWPGFTYAAQFVFRCVCSPRQTDHVQPLICTDCLCFFVFSFIPSLSLIVYLLAENKSVLRAFYPILFSQFSL